MNRRRFGTFAMGIGALLISASALAHHGRALIYDAKKEVTVKGTVTEFVWFNPHVRIGIDAMDDKGVPRHWLIEASSTGYLSQRGWTRKSLKPGEIVTITFNPGLKGTLTGDLVKVVLPDGKELPK
jgi:Family of unknown function (DUF6152)